MKLKDDYVVYRASEEESIAVATGNEANVFSGLLRANKTAGFILECLKEDISEDDLVKAMLEKYDASEEDVRSSLKEILDTLRGVDALQE